MWVIASSPGDEKQMPKKNGLYASIVFSGANVKNHSPAVVFWEFQNWGKRLQLGLWFTITVDITTWSNHMVCFYC